MSACLCLLCSRPLAMGFETVWFSRKGPKPSADGVKGKVISGKGTRECRYVLCAESASGSAERNPRVGTLDRARAQQYGEGDGNLQVGAQRPHESAHAITARRCGAASERFSSCARDARRGLPRRNTAMEDALGTVGWTVGCSIWKWDWLPVITSFCFL